MTEPMLTPDQIARAMAALDAWFTNPGDDYAAPGVRWELCEVAAMHAALEAPSFDDALAAFGGDDADPVLSTPEQQDRNRAAMIALRQRLGASRQDAREIS